MQYTIQDARRIADLTKSTVFSDYVILLDMVCGRSKKTMLAKKWIDRTNVLFTELHQDFLVTSMSKYHKQLIDTKKNMQEDNCDDELDIILQQV